jgi:fatty acid desaturase
MSRKRLSRAAKTKRNEAARIDKIEKERAKEKPQRRQTAICCLIVFLIFIGLELLVFVVSHQTGDHIRLPIAWLAFDTLLLPATLWVIYDWLK